MKIRFLGQSCFAFEQGEARVVVDPFLKPNNPVCPVAAEELEATHVLLTHGHRDHASDATALAKRTGSPLVAITDLARWFAGQGVEDVRDPNPGGTVEFDWGSVELVQAFHPNSTPAGDALSMAAGLIIRIAGTTIYHTGDTCLFGDMRLIGERHSPEIAIVPIGGHYTMDADAAACACELIGAPTVIPCHYDTFPAIAADVGAFRETVEAGGARSVVILEPGDEHQV